jgi:hypothetical protein
MIYNDLDRWVCLKNVGAGWRELGLTMQHF